MPLATRFPRLWGLIGWLGRRAPDKVSGVMSMIWQEVDGADTHRSIAVKATLSLATSHREFMALAREGDELRDTRNFAPAQLAYFKALLHLPLHHGYRVQYAHMLKEQEKYSDAVLQYWYALNLGAPTPTVHEHLLFAAARAGVPVSTTHIARSSEAWANAAQTNDPWALPPYESDLFDFADLFWGSRAHLDNKRIFLYLAECSTRKDLLLAYIRAPETARSNRPLLIMLKQIGLDNV